MPKLESFDFIRYCDDYGIEYFTNAGNLSKGWMCCIDCPRCGNHNGKHHLGISPTGSYSTCWSCGSMSIYELTRLLTPSVNYYVLLETYSGYIDDRKLLKKPKTTSIKPVEFDFDRLGKVAQKYLIKRGFNPSKLEEEYMFRDGGAYGDFRYRVIIPIIYEGKIVSYQGRAYNNSIIPKYKFLSVDNSTVDPKTIFFNLDRAKKDHVIVVEGVMDAIKLAGDTCDNVVASFGITTTESQVQLLSKRFKKVSMCYDPEPVAQERARKMAVKLSALGVEAEVIDTEKNYDLGDSSVEECTTLKKEILG